MADGVLAINAVDKGKQLTEKPPAKLEAFCCLRSLNHPIRLLEQY